MYIACPGTTIPKKSIYFAQPQRDGQCYAQTHEDNKSAQPLCTLLTGIHVTILPLLPVVTESLVIDTMGYDDIMPFCTCERTDFKLNVSKIIRTIRTIRNNNSEPAFGGDLTGICTDRVMKNTVYRQPECCWRSKDTAEYFPFLMSFYYSLVYIGQSSRRLQNVHE